MLERAQSEHTEASPTTKAPAPSPLEAPAGGNVGLDGISGFVGGSSGARVSPDVVLRTQALLGNAFVQRLINQRLINRSPVVGLEGGPVPADVSDRIQHRLGRGNSLPGEIQQSAESALGASFRDVGVHTDAEADSLSTSLGATAFTLGTDIFFASGAYQPGTADGDALVTHELTHVQQQRGMSASGPLTVGAADDSLEQAASSNSHAGVLNRALVGDGAAHVQRDPLASQIPAEVDLTRARVSFQIPKGMQLGDSVYTTDTTTVSVGFTRTGISLSLSPPLHIQAMPGWVVLLSPLAYFGVSDAEWSAAEYSFASASLTSVSLADTGIGYSIQSQARTEITAKVTALFDGTSVATAGYDPMTDPDLMATVAAIQGNAAKLSGGGGGVTGADVSHIELSAGATFQAVHIEDKGNGIDIPGGATASLRLTMNGTWEDVADPAKRSINMIEIETSGIQILHSGSPVATIRRLYINHGGSVTVADFSPEGGLGILEALGALAGALGGMERAPGQPGLGAAVGATEGAEATNRWGREQIEAALAPEIANFVRANRGVIPGSDLATMLGI